MRINVRLMPDADDHWYIQNKDKGVGFRLAGRTDNYLF